MADRSKNQEEAFVRWMSVRVPPETVGDCRRCLEEIKKRCKKTGIVRDSLFEKLNIRIVDKAQGMTEKDKLFRLMHFSQMGTISTVLRLLRQYVEQQQNPIDAVVNSRRDPKADLEAKKRGILPETESMPRSEQTPVIEGQPQRDSMPVKSNRPEADAGQKDTLHMPNAEAAKLRSTAAPNKEVAASNVGSNNAEEHGSNESVETIKAGLGTLPFYEREAEATQTIPASPVEVSNDLPQKHTISHQTADNRQTETTTLSKELQQLLRGEELELLRNTLEKKHILSLADFKQYDMKRFMSANKLYTPNQREDLYRLVLSRTRAAARLEKREQDLGQALVQKEQPAEELQADASTKVRGSDKGSLPSLANPVDVSNNPLQDHTASQQTVDNRQPEPTTLSEELKWLLRGDELELLRNTLEKKQILTLAEYKQYDMKHFMSSNKLYTPKQREELFRVILLRTRAAARLEKRKQDQGQERVLMERPAAELQAGASVKDREAEKESPHKEQPAMTQQRDDVGFSLETPVGKYFGNTPTDALAAFCDDLATKSPTRLQSMIGAHAIGTHINRFLFSAQSGKPGVRLKNADAIVVKNLTAVQAWMYGQWLYKECLERADKAQATADDTPENLGDHLPTVEPESSPIPSQPALAPELQKLLAEDDLAPLREKLAEVGIRTIEQIRQISLWAFVNEYDLYSLRDRSDICSRVRKRVEATFASNADQQPKPVPEESAPADPEQMEAAAPKAAVLDMPLGQFRGETIPLAFAAYCDHLAEQYPDVFPSLVGVSYFRRGAIIVLYDSDETGSRVPLTKTHAYISEYTTETSAKIYGTWLYNECIEGAKRAATQPKQPPEGKPQPSETAGTPPFLPSSGENERDVRKAEDRVLSADLVGITVFQLADDFEGNVSRTRRLVAASPHLMDLSGKLLHENALVDWEEARDALTATVEKLLSRNGGYISASQLFEFVHADLQMFLNDNDLDDSKSVFDLARFLFEKVHYQGLHLHFQGSHISRTETAVSSNLDLFRNYAREQGGVFREEELEDYLQRVGVKTGNLRTQMQLHTAPIFLLYAEHTLMLVESMRVDTAWLNTVHEALEKLFADMGDHVVLRDIQSAWFSLLPELPGRKPWTPLLLQSLLINYSKQLGGAHTIPAMSGQAMETLHAMLVSQNSEVETFGDAVIAFLKDDGIVQTSFLAEELRQLLVQRGMIAGNELIWNMPKALAKDDRFAWSADEQTVTVRV